MSENYDVIIVQSSGRTVDLRANSQDNPLRPLKPGGNIDVKVHPNGRGGYDFTSAGMDGNAFNFLIPSERTPRASLPEPDKPTRYTIDVAWVKNKGAVNQQTGRESFELWVDGFQAEEQPAVERADTLTAISEIAADIDAIKLHLGID